MLQRPRQARLKKGFLYDRERVVCGSIERLSEYIHGLVWPPTVDASDPQNNHDML